ncbi:hypothetical protein BpHYR1_053137 [Brachionus plicatilis]|uniref:Uncharacterized protein n=1 Tax=Brachionus plicatilis TaxID=10195 RepID=A0A3M7SE69_BRAPC|nr:hypothetical protein BpHYR1_053137 [Brachionus plicatilis]
MNFCLNFFLSHNFDNSMLNLNLSLKRKKRREKENHIIIHNYLISHLCGRKLNFILAANYFGILWKCEILIQTLQHKKVQYCTNLYKTILSSAKTLQFSYVIILCLYKIKKISLKYVDDTGLNSNHFIFTTIYIINVKKVQKSILQYIAFHLIILSIKN